MEFYKSFPIPSDRMGEIWTLSSIKDAYIIEFGPAGTTHFAIEGIMQFNGDHKANVYTTHIDESDISLGSHERLEKAIVEIDSTYSPKYIFIMASSISAIIGTDIESVCFEMEPKVKAKLIPITSGGFSGDYTVGVEKTLQLLCKQIVQKAPVKTKSYNIVGNNVDSYKFLADCEEIKGILKQGFDLEPNTIFTAYTSIDELEQAGAAQLNLVFRGEGLKAAQTLEKDHDIPYIYGRPYGMEGTLSWIKSLEEQLQASVNQNYINEKMSLVRKHMMSYRFMTRQLESKSVILVGDYDIVVGLADFVDELGLTVEHIFVKHNLSKKVREYLPQKWKTKIKFNLSEQEIEEHLNENPFYLLLADGSTLLLPNKSKLQFQIANPNLTKHNIYPYTPFVGFNGALFLLQSLYELQKQSYMD